MVVLVILTYSSDDKWHYCRAVVDGAVVGVVRWDGIDALHAVAVVEPYRRQGVATGMWKAIEKEYGTKFRSVSTRVSSDGFDFFSTMLDGFDNDIQEVHDGWVTHLISQGLV